MAARVWMGSLALAALLALAGLVRVNAQKPADLPLRLLPVCDDAPAPRPALEPGQIVLIPFERLPMPAVSDEEPTVEESEPQLQNLLYYSLPISAPVKEAGRFSK